MARPESAGLLLYRVRQGRIEPFLVHPGGPYFTRKDKGFWTIPKGKIEEGEDSLDAARREFLEETGHPLHGDAIALGSIRQKGGKIVHCWAVRQDDAPDLEVRSNSFEMEWPPRSGRKQSFPEADRGRFFSFDEAKEFINQAQAELLERLARLEQS